MVGLFEGKVMYCLNCGWCCERMSPLTKDENTLCPYLYEYKGMKLCSEYETRPEQCINHRFPAKFCPIGMDVLGLDREGAAQRVQKNDFKLFGASMR